MATSTPPGPCQCHLLSGTPHVSHPTATARDPAAAIFARPPQPHALSQSVLSARPGPHGLSEPSPSGCPRRQAPGHHVLEPSAGPSPVARPFNCTSTLSPRVSPTRSPDLKSVPSPSLPFHGSSEPKQQGCGSWAEPCPPELRGGGPSPSHPRAGRCLERSDSHCAGGVGSPPCGHCPLASLLPARAGCSPTSRPRGQAGSPLLLQGPVLQLQWPCPTWCSPH